MKVVAAVVLAGFSGLGVKAHGTPEAKERRGEISLAAPGAV